MALIDPLEEIHLWKQDVLNAGNEEAACAVFKKRGSRFTNADETRILELQALAELALKKKWNQLLAELLTQRDEWTDIDHADQSMLIDLLVLAIQSKNEGAAQLVIDRVGCPDGSYGQSGLTQPLLIMACQAEMESIVCALLKAGGDPNIKSEAGGLLYGCVKHQMAQAFSLALLKGGNPNERMGPNSRPLIMELIQMGAYVQALELLDFKADPNCLDYDGDHLLRYAMQEKMPDLFEKALQHGANPNALCENYKNQPLIMRCIGAGEEEYALALLRAGASPNTVDYDGDPLLRYAMQEKMPTLFAHAIQHGADSNILCKNPKNQPLIMRCIGAGEEEYALALLRAGVSPDTRDYDGDPLLRFAGAHNMMTLFQEVLAKGANPNVKVANGESPPLIIKFVEMNQPELVTRLLEVGALVDVENEEGESFLHGILEKKWDGIFRKALPMAQGIHVEYKKQALIMRAIQHGLEDCAIALLDAGVSPNTLDHDGDLLLRYASQEKMPRLFKRALELGADGEVEYRGEPLICNLLNSKSDEYVAELLRHGVNPNSQNKTGVPLLQVAVEKGLPHVFDWLIQAEADPNIEVRGTPLFRFVLNEKDGKFVTALLKSPLLDEQVIASSENLFCRHSRILADYLKEPSRNTLKKRKMKV